MCEAINFGLQILVTGCPNPHMKIRLQACRCVASNTRTDMPAAMKYFLGHHTLIPDQSHIVHLSLPAHTPPSSACSHRPSPTHSSATSHFRRELGSFGFVSRQQRLSCSAAGFHIGVLLKQRDGKAKTLAPMESRALVSPSLYRRLMVSRSQPFMLTLAK